jgi:hypothetical protein
MRILLLTMLVACSGPATSSPPPVSNQPKPMVAETTPPPVQTLQQPACMEANAKCAMEHMEYFQLRICACKDKACAEATNDAMTKWGTEMAKRAATASRDERPDPAMAKRSADVMTRYTECMTKAYMGGDTPPPPPDPCGGGDDPCGG